MHRLHGRRLAGIAAPVAAVVVAGAAAVAVLELVVELELDELELPHPAATRASATTPAATGASRNDESFIGILREWSRGVGRRR